MSFPKLSTTKAFDLASIREKALAERPERPEKPNKIELLKQLVKERELSSSPEWKDFVNKRIERCVNEINEYQTEMAEYRLSYTIWATKWADLAAAAAQQDSYIAENETLSGVFDEAAKLLHQMELQQTKDSRCLERIENSSYYDRLFENDLTTLVGVYKDCSKYSALDALTARACAKEAIKEQVRANPLKALVVPMSALF